MPWKDDKIAELELKIKKLEKEKEINQYKAMSDSNLNFQSNHIKKAQVLPKLDEYSIGGYILSIHKLDGSFLVEPVMLKGGLTQATKDALLDQLYYTAWDNNMYVRAILEKNVSSHDLTKGRETKITEPDLA